MPHLLSADNGESSRSRSRQRARTEVSEHRSVWDRLSLQKIGSWLKREEAGEEPPPLDKAGKNDGEHDKENGRPHSSGEHPSRSGGFLHRRSSKKVVPGLPRPLTFKRMNSEKRDRLLEVPLQGEPKRAASADRRESVVKKRTPSPPPLSVPSMSAPDILSPHESAGQQKPLPEPTIGGGLDSNIPAGARQVDYGVEDGEDYMSAGEPPPVFVADAYSEHGSHPSESDIDDIRLQEELEAKWILNLSMHFRDMSDREKFFITYAEEPNKWRRVTVSCDYRQLEPESLEADLKTLHYQRDKSSRIYEAIRDSLPDIQFYDTVTNLKLETTDGRLHVHVTEDVNEIIPYPSTSAIDHLECKRFREKAVSFDSHISGFVYKVSIDNRAYIKKEIPGPDAVEEFLYEINALSSLQDSKSVIKFEGIIIDEQNELIKGLLISYAEQGALVDMIYDYKPTDQLHWERRERWARQIVEGLSEIHEAGFVQGDFTLSNIVIDHNDDAKIIDINRRGCPVGWEPPELAKLIESGQRISIYIGVKSDLYQLGMVLWALAEQQDEPERQERPLTRTLNRHNTDVPEYFRDIIRACLCEAPRGRPAASTLLRRFPKQSQEQEPKTKVASRESVSTHRSDKEYIDPATAVDLEDISNHRRHSRNQSSFENINVPPTEYPASSGSYILPNNNAERGRSPHPLRSNSGNRRSDCSPYPGHRSVMSLDDSELENELASLPASRETRWEQVYIDGDTKLVQRGCGEVDVHDFATQEPKDVCITTPPGELENSFMTSKTVDDTPLRLSEIAELQPLEPQLTHSILQEQHDKTHHRGVGSKASFSDRVHQLAQSQTQHTAPADTIYNNNPRHSHVPDSQTLASLEHELWMDSSVSSSAAPSRVGTGFSIFDLPERTGRVGTGLSVAAGHHMPLHQDSGFAEPERVSYESERIRHSLDESINDLKLSNEEENRINERLWDEKDGTMFGEGVRAADLEIRPNTIPVFTIPAPPQKPTMAASSSIAPEAAPSVGPVDVLRATDVSDKALEEKNSNTTIRPPSILIPEFHHCVPKAVDSTESSPPIQTPATGSSYEYTMPTPEPLHYSPQHHSSDLHAYSSSDLKEEEPKKKASDDLADYLSHSISYSQHTDYYYSQEKGSCHEPKV
ncbi:Nn.00g021430.m01.CDS01 [Neocucurbitaria sp. VM-36]